MEETTQPKTNILEVAWNRFAQYDSASYHKKRIQYRLHRWVATAAILATLFAILSSVYPEDSLFGLSGDTNQFVKGLIEKILILLPIIGSSLAAFAHRMYPATDWLVLRAGAEQIMKEIIMYRTVLQTKEQERRVWLETRLREIQAEVFEGLNGEMTIKPYSGKLPPPYDDGSSRSDPGFTEMTQDEYYNLRLREQLDWHKKRVNKAHRERVRLQVWVLLVGIAGAFLAALGGTFSLWVALATSVSAALVGWQALRNLDVAVRNYSKVVLDLNNISDHWNQMSDEEKTRTEYYRMVKNTEDVLWNQNREYLKSMREAVESARMEEEEIINHTLQTRTSMAAQATPAATPASDTPAAGSSVFDAPASEPTFSETPAPEISTPDTSAPELPTVPPPAPTDGGGVG